MQYMGGKFRLRGQICHILNTAIQYTNTKHYYEPFMGGFNIIQDIRCPNRYGSDYNKYLIAFINYMLAGGELPEYIGKETWDACKANPDAYPDWFVFVCGNIISFRKMWFKGRIRSEAWNSK